MEEAILETDAPEILAALDRMNLARRQDICAAEPLAGGVSSDIWLIKLTKGSLCAKRALAKLKTQQDWRAPITRSAKEAAYFQAVGKINPALVPELLGYDDEAGVLVMPYYPPETYKLWKPRLRDGASLTTEANAIGSGLATVHMASTGNTVLRDAFYDPGLIDALRLDPFFVAAASVHPDCKGSLLDLIALYRSHSEALIHGDFSPKNILIGPNGPIILDAECANFGDPAFDVALCLSHLMLKAVWTPIYIARHQDMFRAFLNGYADDQADPALLARAARYVPGLLLARIDGKSPVEYIAGEPERRTVRDFAREALLAGSDNPSTLGDQWYAGILQTLQTTS